ncbi:MAG TPA: YfhO family protein [Pirellulales bacterium]|nr:YfhO family protein [Pirellulales bacterium]
MAAVCCMFPFLPLLAPDGRVIPENPWCDYASFQLPIRIFARDEMLAGRFPLWCPYIGCGAPLHAGEQASLCYPLITPLVLASGAAYGIKASLFLHVAIGFFGAYLLARRLGLSRVAGAFAALVTSWSAFPVCHLMAGHVTIVVQYALAAWVLLGVKLLSERPGALPAVMLATVVGCCVLAGQPQILYYILLFSTLWLAGSLWIGEASAHRGQCLAWGAAAALLSAMISCVQLLPTLELTHDGLDHTRRGALAYASDYALDGGDVFRLWLPGALGNPFVGTPSYVPGEHYHERVVYVGVLTPLLALLGLSRRTAARWQWGAAWLVVLALIISLGNNTPLFAGLGQALPGLLLFRCPGRIFCIASLLAALLAGRGLDALRDGHRAKLDSLAAGVLIWALVNLLAYSILEFSGRFDWPRYARYASEHLKGELAVAGLLTVGAIALAAYGAFFGARTPRLITIAVFAFSLADLGYNNVRNFHLATPDVVRLPDDLVQAPSARFVDAPSYPRLSVGDLQYSKLVGSAIAQRCPTVGTNEGGVLPGSTMALYRALEKEPSILPLVSCRYAYVRSDNTWHQVSDVLPRVRFLADARSKTVGDRLFEPINFAVLPAVRQCMSGKVRILIDEPRRLAIEVNAPSSGNLVVADIYYPGWKCAVDGMNVPIRKAYGVFRAARLDAGRHTVEFSYEPLSFRLGVLGTACGILLGAALTAGAVLCPRLFGGDDGISGTIE